MFCLGLTCEITCFFFLKSYLVSYFPASPSRVLLFAGSPSWFPIVFLLGPHFLQVRLLSFRTQKVLQPIAVTHVGKLPTCTLFKCNALWQIHIRLLLDEDKDTTNLIDNNSIHIECASSFIFFFW